MAITQPGESRLSLRLTRGMLSGMLLLLLGAWGALVPFCGPSFNFGFAPDHSWTWSTSRGWLQVLPGSVAALGGLILLVTAYRAVAVVGACLAAAAAAWYVVGPSLAHLLRIPALGAPIRTSTGMVALQWVALFYGLGALILMLSGATLGRLTARMTADRQLAQAHAAPAETAMTESATEVYRNRPVGTGHHNDRTHAHRHFGRRRAHADADSGESRVSDESMTSGDADASATRDQTQSR